MDIFVFTVFLAFAIAAIFIDFYKEAPYMGVIGGIILILLGIFISVDGSLTTIICNVV
ncbi:MAG: hypothetical protein JSW41_02090 [Candidatus Aenigmatarchaeota archaeon]|nr:MAG: hypothetical protein JSW41_02090 [Candidatus Aenigmarchaeota archaeon]